MDFLWSLKILDDVPVSREAFRNDEVNLLWCTIDALPTEIAGLADFDPVVVFQSGLVKGWGCDRRPSRNQ
jgi:NitT/TauT family transport system substrate-binding protein